MATVGEIKLFDERRDMLALKLLELKAYREEDDHEDQSKADSSQ